MTAENMSHMDEARRERVDVAPLRCVAAVVVGSPGSEQALERCRLLPLDPSARVLPVALAERTDGLGRRGFALVPREADPGDDRVDAQRVPDLVVIARGRLDAPSRLFGSVVEMLARSSEQPVLVTRIPPVRPYARVVVATDLSEGSADVVRLAARVVTRTRVQGTILHVHDTSRDALVFRFRATSAMRQRQLASLGEARERAEAGVADLVAGEPGDRGFQPAFAAGDPATEIRRFVRDHRVELLVLGKHAPSPGRPLLGSVAEACLRRVPSDVLVVPGARPTLH